MANSTDVRQWAREQGIEVGAKGVIPKAVTEQYEQAHSDVSPGPPDPPRAGPGEAAPDAPDYDGGVTEADFPPDGADEPGPELPADEAESPAAERRPRPVSKTKAKTAKSFRERVWGGGQQQGKRKKTAYPRVPLKNFAEDMFLDLAWTFQALPPLEKILYLQAPLAGGVVEDAVKGTVLDKALQPVARFDRQFKALEALTAPAWVAAIMFRGRKDETTGEYSPETKLMFSGLRHALLSMSRIADTDFEQLKSKSEDLRTASGQIDAMIAWLFELPSTREEMAAHMMAHATPHANGSQ